MVVSDTKLYSLLKAKIEDQEAETFLLILTKRVDKKFEDNKDILATKRDVYLLKEGLAKSEARLTMRMFLFWIGQLAAFIAVVNFILLK